jgi:hypothetical protein
MVGRLSALAASLGDAPDTKVLVGPLPGLRFRRRHPPQDIFDVGEDGRVITRADLKGVSAGLDLAGSGTRRGASASPRRGEGHLGIS